MCQQSLASHCWPALLPVCRLRRGPRQRPVKEAWDQSPPRASGAWVRLNPVPGRPSAGYMTVQGGGQPDRLIGASTPGARIELHSMTIDGGVMKMARVGAVPLPAGGKAAFVPGGNHLTIFRLTGSAQDAAHYPEVRQWGNSGDASRGARDRRRSARQKLSRRQRLVSGRDNASHRACICGPQ